jgi:hypothetical protein
MDNSWKKQVIEKYINAYNTFDTEKMVEQLHPGVEFMRISKSAVISKARGIDDFKELLEKNSSNFSSRKQKILKYSRKGDVTVVKTAFIGTLAVHLVSGFSAGATLRANKNIEFSFHNNKISRIKEVS